MAILAAINEKERSKQIVSIAYDLATKYEETLIVLHIIPEEDYDAHKESLENIPEFNDFSVKQKEQSAKRFVRQFVDQAVEDVDIDMVEPRGRVGDVAEEILTEVEQVDPQYLVIGGRRRSPTGKALFGDTAQKIVLNADCPVVMNLSD